jgi:hypothetical protein
MLRKLAAVGTAAGLAVALVLVSPVAAAPKSGGGKGGGGGGSGSSGSTSTVQFRLPVQATVEVDPNSWCDNQGPHITLNTTSMFGGFATRIQFSKNKKDAWHDPVTGESVAELTLSTGEATSSLPKQPPLGGAGGNPFIYIQPDAEVEDYYYIGRCVQDGKIGQLNHGRWSVDTSALATSTMNVQALECSNKGSHLTISTDTTADAPGGNIVLSNSDLGLNPQHIANVAATFGFALGEGLKVRKGGGVSGVGGNPYISSEFGSYEDGVFSAFTGTFNNYGGKRCNKI